MATKDKDYAPARIVTDAVLSEGDSIAYHVEIVIGGECRFIIAAKTKAKAMSIASAINNGSRWVSTCSARRVHA